MFVKTVATIARFSLLLWPVALVAAVDCGGGSDNSSGTAGSSGSAGHAGTSGTAGTTGTGGTGGGSGAFPSCTPMVVPVTASDVLDFTSVPTSNTQATFMYGGTFIYPDAGLAADQMGISSDVTGGNWHITGLVRDYSGFGLYLSCKLDLSAFSGIQFDVKGSFTGNGAGDGGVPTASVTMSVGDAATDVDSAHNSNPPSWGTCVPAKGSQYDGTCASASKAIPLTGASVTQTVHWTDLTGGKNTTSSSLSPDPTQITSIAWAMPWAGTGAAQYTVDITVDNIKFITP